MGKVVSGKALLAISITVLFFPWTSSQAQIAQSHWIGLATPHFELYTTNGTQTAADALQRFEAVRSFFAQAAIFGATSDSLIQVVAFKSEAEYEAYRLTPNACAYYQRTRRGDYIVMQDLAPEHYPVGVHEYTHFLVEHAGLKLPLWLNEGLADLYSSLESRSGQVVLGRPPEGRLHVLKTEPWANLQTLLGVTYSSSYYNQPGSVRIFYAESWALSHMLALSPDYSSQFGHLLSLVSGGTPVEQVFQLLYHKNLADIDADLHDYLRQENLPLRVIDINFAMASLQVRTLPEPQAQVELTLADLAASNPHAQGDSDSENRLRSVSDKYPESPAAEESLGYIALAKKRPDEARAHFAKAVERHSESPDVIFYLAHLQFLSGGSNQPVIDLLQRALALNPDHYNARLELGLVAAKANEFELAVSSLTRIDAIHPEHAFMVPYTLGYCYAHLNHSELAQEYAEKAQRAAITNQDRADAARLLRFIYSAPRTLAENTASGN